MNLPLKPQRGNDSKVPVLVTRCAAAVNERLVPNPQAGTAERQLYRRCSTGTKYQFGDDPHILLMPRSSLTCLQPEIQLKKVAHLRLFRLRWASDLLEMSPCLDSMVRSRRLELPRAFAHNDLNVARLPVPPRPHFIAAKSGAPRHAGNRQSAPLAEPFGLGNGFCRAG